jgi:Zn-dependent protease with chaperone function
MTGLNDFLFQIFQPYFFYSVVFLSITFVSIKIFLKFNPYLSRRSQSIIWLIPLLIPAAVLLLFHPQITVSPSIVPQISVPSGMGIAVASTNFFSFTGLLCIIGAVAAAAYLGFMLCFGRRIALKRFHVVMMGQDEYAPLQQKIKETAQKLRISQPKVSLVDDLLPNAFTVGWGKNTVIVFSLGLLNMLSLNELSAVASHELAHVKAKDYLFKTASHALNLLSFFNPLSYFVVSQSQKERELLADEKGAALLDKPRLMAEVLAKVRAVVQEFPKPSFADRLSSSLFLMSPLAHRPGMLASHPQIAQRVQNIHAASSIPSKKRRYMMAAALLLGILVCIVLVAGYSTVQAQKEFSQKAAAALTDGQGFYLYNSTLPFDPAHPTGIFFADEPNLQLFISSQQGAGGLAAVYVDGNGVTHTYTSSIPDIITVDGQSITVNGDKPFFGNASYPLDIANSPTLLPAGETSLTHPLMHPQAMIYIGSNGTTPQPNAYTWRMDRVG